MKTQDKDDLENFIIMINNNKNNKMKISIVFLEITIILM